MNQTELNPPKGRELYLSIMIVHDEHRSSLTRCITMK